MPTPQVFWDKIADSYSKQPIKDTASYEKTLERVRAHLKPEDKVLELGCGTGGTARLLASEVAHYTASDISERMTEIGRERAAAENITNVESVTAVAEDPQFKPGAYDVVLGFNYIHLVENAEATIEHIHKLLKPGGLFMSKTACLKEKGFLLRLVIPLMRAVGKAPYVSVSGATRSSKARSKRRDSKLLRPVTTRSPAASSSRASVSSTGDFFASLHPEENFRHPSRRGRRPPSG